MVPRLQLHYCKRFPATHDCIDVPEFAFSVLCAVCAAEEFRLAVSKTKECKAEWFTRCAKEAVMAASGGSGRGGTQKTTNSSRWNLIKAQRNAGIKKLQK